MGGYTPIFILRIGRIFNCGQIVSYLARLRLTINKINDYRRICFCMRSFDFQAGKALLKQLACQPISPCSFDQNAHLSS